MFKKQFEKKKQKNYINIFSYKNGTLLIYFIKHEKISTCKVYWGVFLRGQGVHKLVVNSRRSGIMTGVRDVIAFDMGEVLLETDLGMLMLKGNDMHVTRLNLEKGEVEVEGTIDSLTYSEVSNYSKKGESLIGRLFK